MTKKIKIVKDGPYMVEKGIPMTDARIDIDKEGYSVGWVRETEHEDGSKPYALCRCGHSKNKPYCDGEHAKMGFDGTEHATHGTDEANTKVYEGGDLDLIDEESLCASMRFCDIGKGVWQATLDSSDPESKKLAIKEACDCSAGRLIAAEKNGEVHEYELDEEITPVYDTYAGFKGPLAVKGGIELEGADGKTYKVRNRMTLCRCGKSKNMPFCDISHMKCDWMKGQDE